MTIPVNIANPGDGKCLDLYTTKEEIAGFKQPRGIPVYPLDARYYNVANKPATNSTFGLNMNIDATSSGTAENIHDGVDNVYHSGINFVGANFDFESTTQANTGSQSIDGTSTVNGDTALFMGSGVGMNGFNSLDGAAYIISWPSQGNKQVLLQARNAGTTVGNTVDLKDYIDEDNSNIWQTFSIPKSDMGVTTQTVDELTVETIDTGGQPAPNYFLDDIKWSAAGAGNGTQVYELKNNIFEGNFSIIEIKFFFAATVSEADALAYDTILGITLVNGITIRRTHRGEIAFSAVIKQSSDLLQIPFVCQTGGDGTNRWISFVSSFIDYPLPVLKDDKVEVIISDDLSQFLVARVFYRFIDEYLE